MSGATGDARPSVETTVAKKIFFAPQYFPRHVRVVRLTSSGFQSPYIHRTCK